MQIPHRYHNQPFITIPKKMREKLDIRDGDIAKVKISAGVKRNVLQKLDQLDKLRLNFYILQANLNKSSFLHAKTLLPLLIL